MGFDVVVDMVVLLCVSKRGTPRPRVGERCSPFRVEAPPRKAGRRIRRAAARLGVGHAAVYADTMEFVGKNLVVARALDNRIGGFIIAQVMRRLRERNFGGSSPYVLYSSLKKYNGGS